MVWCYTGDPAAADEAFAPVRGLGAAVGRRSGRCRTRRLQSAFDALYPKGLQWYWRGDFVRTVPDEAVAVHARFAEELPPMHSTMHLYPVDGAVQRVGAARHRVEPPGRHVVASDRRRRSGPAQRRRDRPMDRRLLGRRRTRTRRAGRT